MKITDIKCENFLAWRDLTLDLPEKITVLVGRNGEGKSSLLDAIRAALTGTARGIPRGEASTLASWGASSPWAVEIGLSMGDVTGRIRRTATTLSAIRPAGEKVAIKQEQLAAKIGDPRALDALLDTGRALAMTAADRKALVFRLAKVEVTDEQLREAGLTAEDVRVHALAGNWRKAETTAAEAKRAANRAAEEMRTAPVEDPVVGAVRASEVTDAVLDASRQMLERLVAEDRALVEAIGRAKGAAAVSVEALVRQRELAAGELAALDSATAEAELKQLRDKLPGVLEAAKTSFDALEAVKAGELEARQAAERAEDALEELREATREHSCPTCGHSHTAPQIPTSDEIAAADRALAEYRKAAQTRHEAIAPAQEAWEKADGRIRTIEARDREMTAPEGVIARARSARRTVERLDKEIAAAQRAAAAAGGDIAGMEARLSTLRQRQETGRTLLAAVETYRAAQAGAEQTTERIQALRREAGEYERQERLCRPDGIQERLLAPALGPIRERLALWQTLLGYQLVLSDDFEVGIRAGEAVVPCSVLSKSEAWRAGIALADALAQLSGLRWLVLDDAEQLDGLRRAELLGLLAGIAGDYDQVIVAGVVGDREPRQAPEGSGIRVYVVAGGKAEPVAELAEVAR